MQIKILFEDKDILVVNKPAGLMVHADGKSKEETLTDWLEKKYPEAKGVGEPLGEISRSGIVHRLDKETSGVLLLAKNQKAHEFLKKQFQDHSIKKTYIAIVDGWMKDDHGIINKPIGRSPSDFRKRLAGRGARGELREAITEYKVLKKFEAPAQEYPFQGRCLHVLAQRSLSARRPARDPKKDILASEKFSLLEIKPKTGRTHQIRVHLKYLNHPIACDPLYNPGKSCPVGINRLALHAKSIEFKNLKDETVKIESPLPKEFEKLEKFSFLESSEK